MKCDPVAQRLVPIAAALFVLNAILGCSDGGKQFLEAIEACDEENIKQHLVTVCKDSNRGCLSEMFTVARSSCDFDVKVSALRAVPGLEQRIHSADPFGTTLIHAAVEGYDIKLVRWLIENGGNATTANPKTGETPLLLAIRLNDLKMVEYLLMEGANPETADNLGTAPVHAASLASPSILEKVLASASGDANRSDSYGVTPSFLVVLSNLTLREKIRMLGVLVQHGASLSAPIELQEPLPDSRIGEKYDTLPLDRETTYDFARRVLGIERIELDGLLHKVGR